jgi:SAM-dependent methyltransferase
VVIGDLSYLRPFFPSAATFWERWLGQIAAVALADELPAHAVDASATETLMLNLGCGTAVLPGFVNVDVAPAPGVIVADLRQPWPWSNGSASYVYASHIIEHLPDKIFTMNELWRVLSPDGLALIQVPTTDGPGAWQDPTHVSFWNRRSFLYFEVGSPYRDDFAARYGIRAKLQTLWEQITPTPDGPQLSILLSSVKP